MLIKVKNFTTTHNIKSRTIIPKVVLPTFIFYPKSRSIYPKSRSSFIPYTMYPLYLLPFRVHLFRSDNTNRLCLINKFIYLSERFKK